MGKQAANVFIGGALSHRQVLLAGNQLNKYFSVFDRNQRFIDNDLLMNTTIEEFKSMIKKELKKVDMENIDMAPIMMWTQILKTEKLTKYLNQTAKTIAEIIHPPSSE